MKWAEVSSKAKISARLFVHARRDAAEIIKRWEQRTLKTFRCLRTISHKSCIFIGITHSELYISGHVNFYGRERECLLDENIYATICVWVCENVIKMSFNFQQFISLFPPLLCSEMKCMFAGQLGDIYTDQYCLAINKKVVTIELSTQRRPFCEQIIKLKTMAMEWNQNVQKSPTPFRFVEWKELIKCLFFAIHDDLINEGHEPRDVGKATEDEDKGRKTRKTFNHWHCLYAAFSSSRKYCFLVELFFLLPVDFPKLHEF